ncbi:MAG: hypothetical protein HQK49_08985 [Oligoflexia bacterium]|nr:hypothetical protein [Oligoflexia bacterium]
MILHCRPIFFLVFFLLHLFFQLSFADTEIPEFQPPQDGGFPPKGFLMNGDGPPPMFEDGERPPLPPFVRDDELLKKAFESNNPAVKEFIRKQMGSGGPKSLKDKTFRSKLKKLLDEQEKEDNEREQSLAVKHSKEDPNPLIDLSSILPPALSKNGDGKKEENFSNSKPFRSPGFLGSRGPKISADIKETTVKKEELPLEEKKSSKKGNDLSLVEARDLIENFDVKLDNSLGLVELTGNFPSICKNDLRVEAIDTPSSRGYVHFRIIDFTGEGITCLQFNKNNCDKIPCVSFSDLGNNLELKGQYQVRMKLNNSKTKKIKIGILHHEIVRMNKEKIDDLGPSPLIYTKSDEPKSDKDGKAVCGIKKAPGSPEKQIRESISTSLKHDDFEKIKKEIEKNGPPHDVHKGLPPMFVLNSKKDRVEDDKKKPKKDVESSKDNLDSDSSDRPKRPDWPDRRRPPSSRDDDGFSKKRRPDLDDQELIEMEMAMRNKRNGDSIQSGSGMQRMQNPNPGLGGNMGNMNAMNMAGGMGMNGNMMGMGNTNMMGLGSGMGSMGMGMSPMMNFGGFGSMGGMNGNMMGMGNMNMMGSYGGMGGMGMMGLGSGMGSMGMGMSPMMNFGGFGSMGGMSGNMTGMGGGSPYRSNGGSVGFKGGFGF